MITRFATYGLLGWSIEILWTGLSTITSGSLNLIGHTSIWMFFVYGSAAIAFERAYSKISHFNWYVRGIIWTILIFAVEFSSGMLLRLFGIEAWYYNCPLSICGVIRLDYAPAWFVVGIMFEKIYSILITKNTGAKQHKKGGSYGQ